MRPLLIFFKGKSRARTAKGSLTQTVRLSEHRFGSVLFQCSRHWRTESRGHHTDGPPGVTVLAAEDAECSSAFFGSRVSRQSESGKGICGRQADRRFCEPGRKRRGQNTQHNCSEHISNNNNNNNKVIRIIIKDRPSDSAEAWQHAPGAPSAPDAGRAEHLRGTLAWLPRCEVYGAFAMWQAFVENADRTVRETNYRDAVLSPIAFCIFVQTSGFIEVISLPASVTFFKAMSYNLRG